MEALLERGKKPKVVFADVVKEVDEACAVAYVEGWNHVAGQHPELPAFTTAQVLEFSSGHVVFHHRRGMLKGLFHWGPDVSGAIFLSDMIFLVTEGYRQALKALEEMRRKAAGEPAHE